MKYSNSWNWASPSKLLMGRCTRSITPFKNTFLKPMAYDPSEVQRVLKEKQQVQKRYFDQSCKCLEPLKAGDSIRVWQRGTWEPAVLLEKSDKGEPRSYIVWANDHHYRRNQRNILKTQETPLHENSSSEVAEDTNSRDPVADQLPNDPREESDRELMSTTSPTISRVSDWVIDVPLCYQEWFHCSEWHWTLNIFIRELKTHFLTFGLLCYRTVQLTVFAIFVIQLWATGKDVLLCTLYSLGAGLGAVAWSWS